MGDAFGRSVAVGFFDGIHIGHQQLLSLADEALTFLNHPLTVLAPDRAPKLLMTTDRRVAGIRGRVRGHVVRALEFTADLAATEPEDFVRNVFLKSSAESVGRVICGCGWRFGKNGRGDARLLRSMGVEVLEVPAMELAGDRVSSTRIRNAIAEGDVELAMTMLGRPYSVSGVAVAGKGEGTRMGFPTINVMPDCDILATGVYAVEVNGRIGVANYGCAPTFGKSAWKRSMLEVHVLDLHDHEFEFVDGDTEICFLRRVRSERKFETVDDLRRQIAEDCRVVQDLIARKETV